MENPTEDQKDRHLLDWIIIILFFMLIVGYLMTKQQQYKDSMQDSTIFIQNNRLDVLEHKEEE